MPASPRGRPVSSLPSSTASGPPRARPGPPPRAGLPAKLLSQGQKRRLSLARLLVANRRLWILDEPFTALDVSSVRLVNDLILSQLARGGMVILTSHQELDIEHDLLTVLNLDR